jgi:hypothetical protein
VPSTIGQKIRVLEDAEPQPNLACPQGPESLADNEVGQPPEVDRGDGAFHRPNNRRERLQTQLVRRTPHGDAPKCVAAEGGRGVCQRGGAADGGRDDVV